MALLNQNRAVHKRVVKASKDVVDFSRIGGLSHHLRLLRDVIIFPLLHGNVFTHFHIKAPRGVLFYGPPGTGKTLLAGALATEINREGVGKVTFFHRKGADILDKWVGESEKKLRDIFDKATKSRPSIIFFDELDGLAPVRSQKNDHIHASIVATLLSLMDGLDNQPGVIVIGATNRIESIDPALRRPGRFDKELYFPLPATEARKEILQVHTESWKQKPSGGFLCHLAEITGGFSGSDIQALCSEAVLCCMKRFYPTINNIGNRIKIEAESLKIEQCDFLEARLNLLPSSLKHGGKMRNLNIVVKPLLYRQLTNITMFIETLWPHFLQEGHKYTVEDKRYAGRVVLVGENVQGLNTHLIPALLRNFEHLPVFNVQTLFDKDMDGNIQFSLPSIVLLCRIDEWWNYVDDCEQINVVTCLEQIHAGLPILTIATCKKEIPSQLYDFFYNNSSIFVNIENPTYKERETFLAPLFFDEKIYSLYTVLEDKKKQQVYKRTKKCEPLDLKPSPQRLSKMKSRYSKKNDTFKFDIANHSMKDDSACGVGKRKRDCNDSLRYKRIKFCEEKFGKINSKSTGNLINFQQIKKEHQEDDMKKQTASLQRLNYAKDKKYFIRILSDLLSQRNQLSSTNDRSFSIETFFCDKLSKFDIFLHDEMSANTTKFAEVAEDRCIGKIYALWKHVASKTSKDMSVAQLELLYDIISACININKDSFGILIENLEDTFRKIEASSKK